MNDVTEHEERKQLLAARHATDPDGTLMSLLDAVDYIVELERECGQWQEASGQATVRAEQLEDALEKAERERDDAQEAITALEEELDDMSTQAHDARTRVAELERELDRCRARWPDGWFRHTLTKVAELEAQQKKVREELQAYISCCYDRNSDSTD